MKLKYVALRIFSSLIALSLFSVYTFPGRTQGNSSDETGGYILTGAYSVDGQTVTYSGDKTISSTKSSQNVVLGKNGGVLYMDGVTLNKTGDYTNGDGSDFYAVNAVAAAKSASKICLSNATIDSKAQGANNLFASGKNSKIYAYKVNIESTKNSSRGIDATYNGTVVASDLDIYTQGDHGAAVATDRGNGNISVSNSKLATSGKGSPLIYSTGVIEVNNVSGEATGSQIVGMEGLNTTRIKNSVLTGANAKASESVYNGVMLYQSTSGDSSEGTANFEASDSTLTSKIESGSMFYVTNTIANIELKNTKLDFDSDKCYLLYAAGNDASNGWGKVGSNGGDVTVSATNQTLSGKVLCDGVSTVNMYLKNSTWTGSTVNDTTYTGSGKGINVYLGEGAVWNVNIPCTINNLYISSGAKVNGIDNLTIKGNKSNDYDGSGTKAISDFTIDRADFNSYYNISEVADEEEKEEASSEDDTTNSTNDVSNSDYTVIYICVGAAVAVILAGYIIWWIKKKNKK